MPDYFKRYGLNATDFSSRIFIPDTKLSNQISSHWLSKRVLINANGLIEYDLEGILEFACVFDFKDLPFDKHFCSTVIY